MSEHADQFEDREDGAEEADAGDEDEREDSSGDDSALHETST
jgi:hypothetical protein